MYKFMLLGMGLVASCAMDAVTDPPAAVGASVAASFAWTPMGFARVSAAGVLGDRFNSAAGGTGIVSSSGSGGTYFVTFNGLGSASFAAGDGGNVQVTAEGTSNVRCRTINWGGSPNLIVQIQCNAPDGSLATAPLSVGFYRVTTPAPNAFPTTAAYAWVMETGTTPSSYNYNASGTLNTVSLTSTGNYTITIPHAVNVNASMMITPYGGNLAGNVCAIAFWGSGIVVVECRDRTGALANTAFSFSYATTGPAPGQQGGHAWFDGSGANTSYSAALGQIVACSGASVTGSRSLSLATITVAGEIGPHDGTPFVRASFASSYGSAGYCKVESLASSGSASSSTATTTVRCYSATGTVVSVPTFTFTHETSDGAGPC
jgi:hypothetical protein